jgi:hypothetical protein
LPPQPTLCPSEFTWAALATRLEGRWLAPPDCDRSRSSTPVLRVQCIRASLSLYQHVPSAAQGPATRVEQKDRLAGIPRQQTEDQPTPADDLHRDRHQGLEQRFEFHPQDGGFFPA